jgi:crotonobetainyl-CoA:carnitine CoA-transferase CaiB-like acyl-CoA transferase
MNRQVSGRAAGPLARIFVFFRPAPRLGEHTADVLVSIGMDEHEIEALRARGVV